MATISLSSGWVTNVGDKLLANISTDVTNWWFAMPFHNPGGSGASADYGFNYIKMYKGTPPAATTNWATSTAYDSDLLVTWTYNSAGVVLEGSTLKFYSTAPQAAGQSGTATWFAFIMGAKDTTTWGWHGLGTVGVPGSGADMVIGSTTITGGALYAFSDLKFVIPSTFTY